MPLEVHAGPSYICRSRELLRYLNSASSCWRRTTSLSRYSSRVCSAHPMKQKTRSAGQSVERDEGRVSLPLLRRASFSGDLKGPKPIKNAALE